MLRFLSLFDAKALAASLANLPSAEAVHQLKPHLERGRDSRASGQSVSASAKIFERQDHAPWLVLASGMKLVQVQFANDVVRLAVWSCVCMDQS